MRVEQSGCTLRLMNENDLSLVLKWRNTERVRQYMYTDHLITYDEHKGWFERISQNGNAIPFVFELDNVPSAVLQFTDMDKANNMCSWGFYLASENLPRGTGTSLGQLGLKMAFEVLNIRKLNGRVIGSNQSSIHFHEKMGFVLEGRLSRHIYKNDQYEDILCYARFREDYEGG